MKNLYRRYRPLKLSEVVGQNQVIEPLQSSLAQGKVNHAYLFVGPRGCGKTSVARILAHEVNGFQYELEDDYVDIIEIDGASNRGIDNIRELREKVSIAPTSGKYKVYIIDEVHMLTKEAFNALLKTLEEPPEHAIFIMATTDAYKVPVTITSRAQTYTFKLSDAQTMMAYLKFICEKESIKITDEALSIITKRGGGSFRDSLSLLDQISTLSDSEITKDLVISALGLPDDEKIAGLLNDYISGDMIAITASLKELLSSGVKAETLTEELLATIIDKPSPDLLPLLTKLPDVKAPYAEARLLAALFQSGKMVNAAQTTIPASQSANVSSRPTNISPPPVDVPPHPAAASPQPVSANSRTIAPNSISIFDWDGFVTKVQSLSDAIYLQLIKTTHELIGDTLHLYPSKRIVQTILTRDNNKKILVEAAGSVKITIHDYGDTPNGSPKDETLSKISAIMGGEVQNDGGTNPFE